jgi:hypothetical protein
MDSTVAISTVCEASVMISVLCHCVCSASGCLPPICLSCLAFFFLLLYFPEALICVACAGELVKMYKHVAVSSDHEWEKVCDCARLLLNICIYSTMTVPDTSIVLSTCWS